MFWHRVGVEGKCLPRRRGVFSLLLCKTSALQRRHCLLSFYTFRRQRQNFYNPFGCRASPAKSREGPFSFKPFGNQQRRQGRFVRRSKKPQPATDCFSYGPSFCFHIAGVHPNNGRRTSAVKTNTVMSFALHRTKQGHKAGHFTVTKIIAGFCVLQRRCAQRFRTFVRCSLFKFVPLLILCCPLRKGYRPIRWLTS